MSQKSVIFALSAVAALTACSPPATRSADGLLILSGPYPETFNLNDARGDLTIKGRCVIFIQPGVGQFQPIFPKGWSRARLEQQIGELNKPAAVSVGGFDPHSELAKTVARSEVSRQCPGAGFLFSGIVLASTVREPPPPYPAQP